MPKVYDREHESIVHVITFLLPKRNFALFVLSVLYQIKISSICFSTVVLPPFKFIMAIISWLVNKDMNIRSDKFDGGIPKAFPPHCPMHWTY